MPSIILCISHFFETIFHNLIVFKKLFLNLNLWRFIRIFFFVYTFSTFFPQLQIVFTLPKCKAAPYALDKAENLRALWDKCRDPCPVLIRDTPHHREHQYIWHWLANKVEKSSSYYPAWKAPADIDRSICSSHLKAKSVWFRTDNCSGLCGSYFQMLILFWLVMIKVLFSLPASDIPHKGK